MKLYCLYTVYIVPCEATIIVRSHTKHQLKKHMREQANAEKEAILGLYFMCFDTQKIEITQHQIEGGQQIFLVYDSPLLK